LRQSVSDSSADDVFEITHQTRILDFHDGKLCCIIDDGADARRICEGFANDGFDYNLKGLILRRPDGHQMGCRLIIKNDGDLRDYRCAPSNEWISELRRSKRIGIADAAGATMMVCDELWTGDIEDVLKRFYSDGSDI